MLSPMDGPLWLWIREEQGGWAYGIVGLEVWIMIDASLTHALVYDTHLSNLVVRFFGYFHFKMSGHNHHRRRF